MDGGYEPCKDGASRMVRGNLDDQWQHAFHPRRFPDTAGREDILHVDRQVYGVGNWFNPRSNCHSAWVPVLDERETLHCGPNGPKQRVDKTQTKNLAIHRSE
jgi:hypothetical protein